MYDMSNDKKPSEQSTCGQTSQSSQEGQPSEPTANADSKEPSNDTTSLYPCLFDSTVKKAREKRKLTFGPNCKRIIRPSNIVIDIYGVICPWKFVDTLKEYAKTNLGSYVKENWNNKIMKAMVARMRKQIEIDRKAGFPIPEIAAESASETEQIQTAATSVVWLFEKNHDSTEDIISLMCDDLWSKSFDSGRLKPPCYPDVIDAFKYWRFEEFIKIYCYASGSVDGQRKFLKATDQGDLNQYIANALNASGGSKYRADKFKFLGTSLREPKLNRLLYITDSPSKAMNAIQGGLRALVVNREDTETELNPNNLQNLNVVTTLADIQFVEDPEWSNAAHS